ncbi:MAG: YhfC family glutamic-type intramembrane protease [Romboutsia sp.]
MVDTSVIVFLVISVLICFLIPLISFIYFVKSKNHTIKPFLIGILMFFISQIVIRIPILTYVLPNTMWFIKMSMNPWVYGIFLGLTAGIFEEVARYIGFKYILKNNNRYIDGISYGFGHGGIEAILITGVSLFSTLIFAIMLNKGANLPEEVYTMMVSLTETDAFLGGFERICAITIHIGLSIIVLYSVQKRKIIYLGIAILIHTIVNAPIVIFPAIFNIGVIGAELYIFVCALILGLLVLCSKKYFKKGEFENEKA